jgi:hypothetical protein
MLRKRKVEWCDNSLDKRRGGVLSENMSEMHDGTVTQRASSARKTLRTRKDAVEEIPTTNTECVQDVDFILSTARDTQ